jgi:HEAT repeat protein
VADNSDDSSSTGTDNTGTDNTGTDNAGTEPAGAALAEVEAVVMAGHRGDTAVARAALGNNHPSVRTAALGALARTGSLTTDDITAALSDPAPEVRRRACELTPVANASGPGARPVELVAMLSDPDDLVAEMAAWAVGERIGPEEGVFLALVDMTRNHQEPLCREAAAASLGAVAANHPDLDANLVDAGLHALVDAMADKAPVRRRAVLALAAFDDPVVETTLAAALDDRDWQVRQGAEDLLGPPEPESEEG